MRINPPSGDASLAQDDLDVILPSTQLQGIVIPKVESAKDIRMVIERAESLRPNLEYVLHANLSSRISVIVHFPLFFSAGFDLHVHKLCACFLTLRVDYEICIHGGTCQYSRRPVPGLIHRIRSITTSHAQHLAGSALMEQG